MCRYFHSGHPDKHAIYTRSLTATPTQVIFFLFLHNYSLSTKLCGNQSQCRGIFSLYGSTVSPMGVKWEWVLVFRAIRRGDTRADSGRHERGGLRSPQRHLFLEVAVSRGSHANSGTWTVVDKVHNLVTWVKLSKLLVKYQILLHCKRKLLSQIRLELKHWSSCFYFSLKILKSSKINLTF